MAATLKVREKIEELARKRILILDGAMGALIAACRTPAGEPLSENDFRGLTGSSPQGERFMNHPAPLRGCNEILCLTMPEIITGIHEAYLKAGADIIETCSLNASSVSLADYGLAETAYEISVASANLARRAADKYSSGDRPRFVAGSIGPTAKSLSISPDMDDPAKRAVGWDDLEAAYYENARGLIDGGADIIIIETIFDTLNAKAAIFAIRRLMEDRGVDIPVIVSATVLNSGGRLLSGQTVEAFCVSVLHADPLAVGLNCSFGAEKLKAHIEAISVIAPCMVSAYPNAGFPDQMGVYEQGPETMADYIEEYLRLGLVNIVGGCCGSTPDHIAAIAARAEKYLPRPVPPPLKKTLLAGLEVLEVNRKNGFTAIGERCNTAGSREFHRLIEEGEYDEAAETAIEMAEEGAAIVDVCVDTPLLDAKTAMRNFLCYALQYPNLARLPIMIDSSDWDVIETGLKCLQGKGIVNSISLKGGETEFLRRARRARSYGAAMVVMLIDEEGLADSFTRRIRVAARSWKLLINAGIPQTDIVFDPNVFPVGMGLPGQEFAAMDFIRACAWIEENCPGAQIMGGISNLSFSFRGSEKIRGALHTVFIKHAAEQGLSMAIVNPATLVSRDEIDSELWEAAEDLILNRGGEESAGADDDDGVETLESVDPAERLLALAEAYGGKSADTGNSGKSARSNDEGEVWRGLPVEERMVYAMIRGIDGFIAEDIEELRSQYRRPLEILEGPLMRCLREVGDRFGTGRIFLPQLIRAARVMKKASAALEPYLEAERARQAENKSGAAGAETPSPAKARIVIATVKGDVHDMGKNLAAMILKFNGYEIIDIGVMAPAEKILEKAAAEKADIIGLSGLITPSLDEMVLIAREMERRGFTIPLLVGGAAPNLAHTALCIAPEYSGPVVYIQDAGQAPGVIRALLSETERPLFLEELKKSYTGTLIRHDAIQQNRNMLSLEEARKNRAKLSWDCFGNGNPKAEDFLNLRELLDFPGALEEAPLITLNDYPLERAIPHFDWESFVQTWDLAANTYPLAYHRESREEKERALQKMQEDARALLEKISREKILSLRGVVGFFPACSEGDDIVLPGREARFVLPRNQERKPKGAPNSCLADFILPSELRNEKAYETNPAGWLGLFALSAGFGLKEAEDAYRSQNDDYSAILLAGIANFLAEAFSEEIHRRLGAAWGGRTSGNEKAAPRGIRPVFGYPACPDHRDKEIVFRLLGVRERCGLDLTETGMIIPSASVCGMYIAHPDSHYFSVGLMGDDQLQDWIGRKGITRDEARKRLGWLL